jgi:hypothetical protein
VNARRPNDSVAIWAENGSYHCDWGPLDHTWARFDREPIEVGPTMVTTESFAAGLYIFGPRQWGGALNTIEIAADDRIYWHADAHGQRWTWELFPAHFTDGQTRDIQFMIGRWPD